MITRHFLFSVLLALVSLQGVQAADINPVPILTLPAVGGSNVPVALEYSTFFFANDSGNLIGLLAIAYAGGVTPSLVLYQVNYTSGAYTQLGAPVTGLPGTPTSISLSDFQAPVAQLAVAYAGTNQVAVYAVAPLTGIVSTPLHTFSIPAPTAVNFVVATSNLAIASGSGNYVNLYETTTYTQLHQFAATNPQDLFSNGFGRLYIADTGNNQVTVWEGNTPYTQISGSPIATPAPTRLGSYEASSNEPLLAVAGSNPNVLALFDATSLTSAGSLTAGIAQAQSLSRDVISDVDLLAVVNGGTGTVTAYNDTTQANGSPLQQTAAPTVCAISAFQDVSQFCAVANSGSGTVTIYAVCQAPGDVTIEQTVLGIEVGATAEINGEFDDLGNDILVTSDDTSVASVSNIVVDQDESTWTAQVTAVGFGEATLTIQSQDCSGALGTAVTSKIYTGTPPLPPIPEDGRATLEELAVEYPGIPFTLDLSAAIFAKYHSVD